MTHPADCQAHQQGPFRTRPSGDVRPRWQQELAQAIRSADELLRLLDLDPGDLPQPVAAGLEFATLVPRGFVALMRRGDPHDPLLRQVLPLAAERKTVPGFVTDPVGDIDAERTPGLLQKYAGRALLLVTGACAVHCRYCFRRHFPYAAMGAGLDPAKGSALGFVAGAGSDSGLAPAAQRLNAALRTLADAQDINEVILSGGDPLLLDDAALDALITRLEAIPHLRRLRLHSRIPVLLPSRITTDLVRRLADSRLDAVVMLHANHAAELGPEAAAALSRLAAAGIPLFNQSVLLRGVNADLQALAALSERLFALRVIPCYLHQLDRVAGSAHFEVGDTEALELLQALRGRLPGYLLPRLVRELPGENGKMPVG
ncbi:radical SAM protein [Thiohalocapsa marina]|uniref:Radical SAM protein n=1 Tax=Thiohalocapsa marina TaxID=424902 RepID=A0A5M8FJ97_9GAMM|nr:radical SAM protein [Thiohalocapsa marina]KAA6184574.1 radical SAM protein [Thiohalocapsa marina]